MNFLGIEIKFKRDNRDQVISEITRELEELRSSENFVTKKDSIQEANEIELPTSAGRSSQPENVSLLSAIYQELAQVKPEWNIEFLKALEFLGMHNADVSYAVDNIVQLGNTDYNVTFDDAVSPEQAKEMKAYLAAKSRTWYKHSEGVNSLINDLLAQVAITGVVSAEIVPDDGLTGVGKVVLVSPRNIRFVYDAKDDTYKPYQVINNGLLTGTNMGLHPLNETTYKYMALRRFNENPYGIPPFLAALEGIGIERDMRCGMANIIKRMGALGFLEVLLNKPAKLTNETDGAYQQRMLTYLGSVTPEVAKSMSKGYVVGFRDTHEFKLEPGASANADGAEKLFEINDRQKFAGMKQDGLMFGMHTNTSETLGRVIITKTTNQVVNHQKLVAMFLREVYLIELGLAGFKVASLDVVFDKPLLSDRYKDEQAYQLKILNGKTLRDENIIDQQGYAEYVGYEKPAGDKPVVLVNSNLIHPDQVGKDNNTEGGKGTDPAKTSNMREDIASYEAELGIFFPEYDYGSGDQCGCDAHTFERAMGRYDSNNAFDRYTNKYLKATREQYRKSINAVAAKIGAALSQLGQGATVEQVTDRIIYTLYKNWKSSFTDPQKKIISKYVQDAYVFFRKSTNVFGSMKNVPDATFGLVDTRTISYFQASDELYLGKFITDSDTRKALTKFIKDKYIEGALPLGSTEGMAAFKEQFGDLFQGAEWKLDRIISTTVNKLRSSAAVTYMQQAGVENFEIVGVNDRLQCGYCKNLQGKQFSVTIASDKVVEFVKSDPSSVKYASPFITSLYKKPEMMADLTGAQLQAAGIQTPPFHCGCRDTIVAVL